MKLKHVLFISIAIFGIFIQVNSQTLNGKVLNESGFAASNVTVHFSNKANSITTNKNGTFSIKATKLPDTLIFSATGLESYKVVITAKNIADPNFEVVLLNKREAIDEETSAAYSEKAKRKMTFAAAEAAATADGYSTMRSSSITDYAEGSKSAKRKTLTSSSIIKSEPYYKAAVTNKKLIFTDSVSKKDGNNYATRLLTAGEVNDFSKWKMWDDYTDKDFKEYANIWKISVKQRYTVELQSKTRYPVIGHTVYLINKNTNDTVWTAITDNTGKAELWANVQTQKNNLEFMIAVQGFETIQHPYTFTVGINRLTINKECSTNNKVEIAFVVDATGSMGDEIEYLKLELEDVLNKTFAQYQHLDIKAGSVFYRDHDDEYVTKYIPLNSDLLKVLNFIKLQKAAGGGDMPEAVEEGLETAIEKLEWSSDARTKIMFLILDAPPHLTAQNKIYNLIQQAAAKGIRVVPIVCSGADKQTEFLMRSIALATNGTYLFLTSNSGIGDEHIAPTTDAFSIELLNNLLPRIIQQMVYTQQCNEPQTAAPYKVQTSIVKLQLSPNPTRGNLTITANKPIKDMFITDFAGKILMRINTADKQLQWKININHFPSSTYVVRYVTNENEWGTEKIILVH